MGARAARTESVLASDGVQLAIHRIGDAGSRRVLFVPGTFSNHTFWLGTRGTGFARAAAAAGFEAWCLDPRGHGASQRPARTERWDFDDWARRDVPAAITAATADGSKVALVGHSAGGAAALAALAGHPELRPRVQAVAAIATPTPWGQPVFRGLLGRFVRALSARSRTFPARLMRLGPEDELAGVMEQWMGWNFDGAWRGDDGTDYGAALADLRMPALVIAATADRLWAPPEACHGLFQLIGSPDRRYVECGRANGFRRDYGHVDVIVGRDAREDVWPLLIEWLAMSG